MLKLATLAALLAAVPTTAAADCAFIGLAPQVLVANASVPPDGGILVAALPNPKGALGSGDAALPPGWRFRGVKTPPAIDVLAPGLAVFRPPAASGSVVLEDEKQVVVGTAKVTKDKRARLGAPKVSSISYRRNVGRRVADQLTVALDGDPPAEAIALVVADAKGTPRSWGRVGGRSITAYAAHSCVSLPNGTVASKPGDQIIVYFVDDAGRKLEATKPITVVAARP